MSVGARHRLLLFRKFEENLRFRVRQQVQCAISLFSLSLRFL